jgi:hypothetical protein
MKVRVWYHPDGKISVTHGTVTDDIDRKLRLAFPESEFEDIDDSMLPNSADPTNREDRNRWRGAKATGIQVDGSVVLRKDILKQLDDELEKSNPDTIKVIKLQRKLDKREHD